MASRNLFVNIIGVDRASAAFEQVGAAALAAGAAGGIGLATAMTDALDLQDVNAKVSAQLGLTGKEAKKAGALTGKLFADNFGDSIEQTGDAVRLVIGNIDGMRSASAKSIRAVTEDVLNLSTAFGVDMALVTDDVSTMLRTGLAPNAKAALDILTAGMQKGANKAGDLLDTFQEYPTLFRNLGLSGKLAMGIISQGLKAGARNSDIVADALKEFSIRAVDGTKLTAQGFKGLGLSAKKMASDIAAGGPRATKALDLTLDRLRAVKDPVKQAQLAVALFGTQAEDLGRALFAMDPSKAVSSLGKVDGAASRFGDTLNNSAKKNLMAFMRSLSTGAANVLGGKVIPVLERLVQVIRTQVVPVVKSIVGWMKRNMGVVKTLAVALGVLVVATKAHAAALAIQAAGGVVAFMTTYLRSMKLVTLATKVAAAAQWLWNAAMSANPITLIILALVALGIGLLLLWKKSETFRNIVLGVWSALKTGVMAVVNVLVGLWRDVLAPVFMWLWTSIIKPVVGFIIAYLKVWLFVANLVIMAIRKLIEKVIAPVITWFWTNVVKPVIGFVVAGIRRWGRIFNWLWSNVIKPVWNAISGAFRTVWRTVIKPVFNAIASIIRDKVAPAFRKGVDFIAKAWNRMKAITKKPINFVIGTVVNKGIIGTLNKVAKWLGVKQRLGTIPLLASGGTVPARPGVFNSPTAIVGEGNPAHPEFVIPTDPKYRSRALKLWEAAGGQLMADGGVLGLLSGPAEFMKGKLAGPIGAIKDRFGSNAFVKLVSAVPKAVVKWAVDYAKKLIGFGGGKFLGKSGDSSVGAIAAVARRFYPGARVSSGYRPGSPDYHGRGLAADLIGGGTRGMARIAAGFYRMSGRLIELIHSGGGGFFAKNGRRVGSSYYRSVLGEHYNHVHVAARKDALIGSYRYGTSYVPRDGVAYLHKGERVVTAEENKGGGTYNINVQAWSDRFSLRQIQSELQMHGAG